MNAKLIRLVFATGLLVSAVGCASSSSDPSPQAYDNASDSSSSSSQSSRSSADRPVSVASIPYDTIFSNRYSAMQNDQTTFQGVLNGREEEQKSLKVKVADSIKKYNENAAYIIAQLQVGTTPNNPELNEKWNQANASLNALNDDLSALSKLSDRVKTDAKMATYIQESSKATYFLTDLSQTDKDKLKSLENATMQSSVNAERLSKDIQMDVERQKAYAAGEQKNMALLATSIKDGRLYGTRDLSGSGQTAARSSGTSSSRTTAPVAAPVEQPQRRPFLVIRFDRPNVAYEQTLYQGVKTALEKKPSVAFDVVTVTPEDGSVRVQDAEKNTDSVVESLTTMGFPSSRISRSQATSKTAKSAEVHLYAR